MFDRKGAIPVCLGSTLTINKGTASLKLGGVDVQGTGPTRNKCGSITFYRENEVITCCASAVWRRREGNFSLRARVRGIFSQHSEEEETVPATKGASNRKEQKESVTYLARRVGDVQLVPPART
ncbi:MAG: hypothetical protein JW395_1637 [Nitrospira sp.]|nr:hypothetical protein [Nitrospira sp.]